MEVPSIYLNRILSYAAKQGASSLHLSVGSLPMMRAGGRLMALTDSEMITTEILERIIASLLSEDESAKFKEEKEIVVVKNLAGDFRFRINIFYQKDLPSLSFNYIPSEIRNLENYKMLFPFKEIINLDSGLIIIAGPSDSGKTSTIASFIEEVNKSSKKYITTLEDPIEYSFINKQSIIEQRQIGRDVKSFIEGLKHCLREDPDLVYVSEIKKDFETAWPSISELAAGNCIVVLEMNSPNSVRVIEQLLNAAEKTVSAEAARYSLADILLGIISQKLIPAMGGGSALAAEVLIANEAIKSLIREKKIYQIESIIQTSRREGMISMEKAIEDLEREGKISAEEARKIN